MVSSRLTASLDRRPTLVPLLWLSPDALDAQDRQLATAFRQTSLSSAPFNGLTTQFTLEFWRNDFTRGPNRQYLNRSDGNAHWSFAIASGDVSSSTTDATRAIKVYLSADGTTTKTRVVNQTLPNREWSQCVVVYQGNQATDDTKLKVYLDGQLVPHAGSAGLPATLHDNHLGLNLGFLPGQGSEWGFDCVMNRVRVWTLPLSPTQVTQLWNGGSGLYYSELAALQTNLQFCADVPHELSDLSSNGLDLTVASDASPQPAWIVTRILDLSRQHLVFGSSFGQAFHWEVAGLGGRPAWVSYGYSQAVAPALRWGELAAGEIILGMSLDPLSFGSGDYSLLSSSDSERADALFRCQLSLNVSEQITAGLRLQSGNLIDATLLSPPLGTEEPLVLHWRGIGQGNGQSLQLAINGGSIPLTPGSAANHWLASIPARDQLQLGTSLAALNSALEFGRIVQGELLVLPLLADPQSVQISQVLCRKYLA